MVAVVVEAASRAGLRLAAMWAASRQAPVPAVSNACSVAGCVSESVCICALVASSLGGLRGASGWEGPGTGQH